jgi:hypothetical protein
MALLFVTLTILGGGGVIVTGTVKFSDGTPVDFGSVAFDDGKKMFNGTITNGNYATGISKVEKIPAGTYRVYLQGTTVQEKTWGKGEDGSDILLDYKEVPRVAAKYTSPETSGLTLEVKGGKQTFDMTVEKP